MQENWHKNNNSTKSLNQCGEKHQYQKKHQNYYFGEEKNGLGICSLTKGLHDLRKRGFRGGFETSQTNRQTRRHRNSMTKLAEWVDSVKIIKYLN